MISVVALLALASCAEVPRTCTVEQVIDVPLLSDAAVPVVEATFHGERVALIIDTGGFTSTVTRAAVDHFGLTYTGDFTQIRSIGGIVQTPVIRVSHLMVGHGVMPTLRLPVVGMPIRSVHGVPVLGLFGADILANYDVDLDVMHHHLGVYLQRGCARDLPPIAQPYFEVPLHVGPGGKIEIDVQLNGVPIHALLDTGAAETVITLSDATRAGVMMTDLQADRAERFIGVGRGIMLGHHHAFGSLEIGDETLHDFKFGVADIATGTSVIGNDFLRHNRVLISYWRQILFVQPQLGAETMSQLQPPETGAAHSR